jgi:hypothetical protein
MIVVYEKQSMYAMNKSHQCIILWLQMIHLVVAEEQRWIHFINKRSPDTPTFSMQRPQEGNDRAATSSGAEGAYPEGNSGEVERE